ncbi:hypothetical protein D5F93_11015 [Streptococcus agalactiae]|nr:hypothetical protein D5F93_11015 [Streptococcus agalactiae]
MGINLFLVKSRNSTIQDLFLFVFTQDILHYLMLYFKYSVLIFFPIALMLLILSRLLLENIDFFERKNAINEIKKQYNF